MTDLNVAAPREARIRLALSAVVLGALAVVLAFIPGACYVAILPAVLAALMGVHGIRQGVPEQWQARAGVALAPVAVVISALSIAGVVRF